MTSVDIQCREPTQALPIWIIGVRVERMFMLRPVAHYAWETFKERSILAARQAMAGWIDDLATAAREAIDPTP